MLQRVDRDAPLTSLGLPVSGRALFGFVVGTLGLTVKIDGVDADA